MKLIKTLGTLFLLFAVVSCENDKAKSLDENSEVNTSDVFKLRVLNEQGEETTTFLEGENVIFSFLVINKTDEDAYFYHTKMNLDSFFEVYKLNTAGGDISLGKPYSHIFCEFVGSLRVPENDTLKIEIPWLWKENQEYGYIGCPQQSYHSQTSALTPGEYLTGFSSSFKLNDSETEVLNFEVKFTIK